LCPFSPHLSSTEPTFVISSLRTLFSLCRTSAAARQRKGQKIPNARNEDGVGIEHTRNYAGLSRIAYRKNHPIKPDSHATRVPFFRVSGGNYGPQDWTDYPPWTRDVDGPHLRRPRFGDRQTQIHRQSYSRRPAPHRPISTRCSPNAILAATSAPPGKPSASMASSPREVMLPFVR